jgi:hypothetical protein
MNQDIENIIKKNLPEIRKHIHGKECKNYEECEKFSLFERASENALSKINTSLIADEVLKVVVETTINMLRDESMLAECITKTLGYGHHYSTIPVLRGIVSEIEKKLLLDNNKK